MDIGLAGWSLNRRFRDKNRPLRMIDYPALARAEFGIDQVELNSPFLEYADPDHQAASAIKGGYLKELRDRADDAGVRIIAGCR